MKTIAFAMAIIILALLIFAELDSESYIVLGVILTAGVAGYARAKIGSVEDDLFP